MLIAELQAFALELAAVAAAETLPGFRRGGEAADKTEAAGVFDPVTSHDREAEAVMRRLIGTRHPAHGVIGEEYGEDRPDAEWVWLIDPIDGTRAYISGLPTWTTLIALLHRGEPLLGTIAQPVLGEIFLGAPDGAVLRTAAGRVEPLRTRLCASLGLATLATTDPYLFTDSERPAWERLRAAARLVRFGCDAYAYAMLAAGHIDVVCESGLKLWDWAALAPIVTGAGGRFGGWDAAGPETGRILALGDPSLSGQCEVLLSGRP